MRIKFYLIAIYLFFILPQSFVWTQSVSKIQETMLSGAFLNQPFPTTRVTRFAPLIFNEELHAPPIFSPQGDEVYWSLMSSTQQNIMCMKLENGTWTDPAPASFSFNEGSDSPFISSYGTKLFFLSVRNANNSENIWIVEKNSGEWGIPNMLGNEVNSFNPHWQASIADNNNLYFGGAGDIYFSEFTNGSYTTAQRLGPCINSENGYETSPFISRDESYLIYAGVQGESYYSDLFICYKQSDGTWGEPIELTELNTEAHELYANVSANGRFIMFLSSRSGILLPYWVDAKILNNYITSIGDKQNLGTPEEFHLYQNYPNPFNPTTVIEYSIPSMMKHQISNSESGYIPTELAVYDILGCKISTLVSKNLKPGNYKIEFNARHLPSGIYIYSLTAGSFNQTQKMILIK